MEALVEVEAGAAEDTEVEDIAKEDKEEGAMVITHMNFPEGKEHLWQNLVYTLQTNGDSYPHNKNNIFNKWKLLRD